MKNWFLFAPLLIALMLIATVDKKTLAQPEVSNDIKVPLVVVNGDTITTYDLELELEIMKKMNSQEVDLTAYEPEQVLRRLIQNQMILQEGYRLEIEKNTVVSNQVREFVRTKAITALLDSISLSVEADSLELREARRNAVLSYIDGLKATYEVFVDSTLLKSLDYGSADPDVQENLRTSTDVLAVVPTGKLTVAKFSKELRFKEFHGLVGKPDAAERRDEALREWVTEAVLSYQVRIQGAGQDPEIQKAARDFEHVLVRQETINFLLQTSYEPTEDEIETFYNENINEFMAPMRIKMKSKKLNTKEAAEAFREKLLEGVSIEWLAKNDPEVIQGNDPFPYEWIEAIKLGLNPEGLEVGFIPEPYGVPAGWVVGVVDEIEEPRPVPLSEARKGIVSILKARNKRDMMTDIMAKLENASVIETLPGAEDTVREVLQKVN
jgi:hypothetical protein